MFTKKQLFFMICESPLHAGSGSELDYIDMPIQRERHTGFPKVESSTLKGAIRERFNSVFGVQDADKKYTHPDAKKFEVAFGAMGKQQDPGNERQGSLAFTDARLLMFPVKSMKGVFAWITCEYVLKQFEKDMMRHDATFKLEGGYVPGENRAIVFVGNNLEIPGADDYGHIILEEYPFLAEAASSTCRATGIAFNQWIAETIFPDQSSWWHRHLKNNLVIVRDNDFADFVELSTEVITRNRIDPKTGTVEGGALFTEEYLPTDSILYSIAMAHSEFIDPKKLNGRQLVSDSETMDFFQNNMTGAFSNSFRMGGNETIGKGMIRTVIV